MSKEHAMGFIERMWFDVEFSRELMGIADFQTKMAYINREGFSFSLEELQHAQREWAHVQSMNK
ncbi:MAG: Nif11-like leader peptide family natural product precursor [Chlorobiaceae bacterium]